MNAHSFRLVPFLFGLFFVALALVWAAWQADVISTPDLRLVGPALLVIAGIAGLVATIASTRNRP